MGQPRHLFDCFNHYVQAEVAEDAPFSLDFSGLLKTTLAVSVPPIPRY